MDINNLAKAGKYKKELDRLSAINKFFEVAADERSKLKIVIIETGYSTGSHADTVNTKILEEFRVTDSLKNALKLGKAECKQRILEIKDEIKKL